MIAYRTLLVLATLPALVAVWFFLEGLADGSVSGLNLGLWLGLLASVCGAPVLGFVLHGRGQPGAAKVVLSLGAVPTVCAALLLVVLLLNPPHWQ
ncbi:hypothetical protein [Falsiroseomonas sp. HW251]|uniref:hypothetical protein n=1 Tax=Falsiroseomonas sp. HW251 TaxID=3390998 RepID=UPI003D318075